MTQDLSRDIGTHGAKIEALERDISLMRGDLHRMSAKLDEINSTLAEAKGGWRTIMWISGASAAVGGLIAKIAPALFHLPR